MQMHVHDLRATKVITNAELPKASTENLLTSDFSWVRQSTDRPPMSLCFRILYVAAMKINERPELRRASASGRLGVRERDDRGKGKENPEHGQKT